MPSLEVVQTNFTRGELSPRLRSRLDFEGFFNGVAEMREFYPVVQGAAVKRPGTRHVNRQDGAVRLLPFEFNVEQTYVLAFEDGGVKFYTERPALGFDNLVLNNTALAASEVGAFSISNGTFDSDLTNWTTTSGSNSSVSQNNGRAELQVAAGESASLEQEIAVSILGSEKDHFIRLDIGTTSAPKGQEVEFRVGTASGTQDLQFHRLQPGNHLVKFNPGENDTVYLSLHIVEPDSNVTVFVDNIVGFANEDLRLPVPYSADQAHMLSWAQSADVLFLAHPNYFPRELRRLSEDEFSLVFYDYEDGPFDDVNPTTETLEFSAQTGEATVTLSSSSAVNNGEGFKDSDVGRLIRFRPDNAKSTTAAGDGSTNVFTFDFPAVNEEDVRVTLTNNGGETIQNIGEGATIEAIPEVDYKLTLNEDGPGGEIDFSISKPPASNIEINITRDNTFWGWAEIVQVNSITEVKAIIRNDDGLAGLGPSSSWRLGSWTGTGNGFPHIVTFHDQRLCFGSSFRDPQNLWMSKSAAFNTHSPTEIDGTVNADNALNVALATSQVNFIRWLSSFSNGLAVGTSGSEFLVRKSGTAEPLGPENIQVQKQTRRGSAPFVPEANIGHTIFFIQRDRQTLREAAFDFDTNGLVARDLSVFSEHLLRPGVSRMAYQQSPESILWMLTDDGSLVALTIESDQQVFGWTKHNPRGKVVSITTITDPASENDRLWMVVEREVNGETQRHVEFMESPWFGDRDKIEDAFFLDGGATFVSDFPIDRVIEGLDHLEGKEVAILADGAVADRKVVENGRVSLETNNEARKAETIHVGLPYTAKIETFPYDQGQRGSTSKGKVKRISEIEIQFFETVGILYGRKELDRLPFRDSGKNMNQPVPVFTGARSVNMPTDFAPQAIVKVQSDQPLPATILSLTIDMVFEDL